MDNCFDVKSWMEPFNEGMHNIVYPHVFKFIMDGDRVVMKYKNWAKDPEWLPRNSTGLNVFKVASISTIKF